MLILRPYQNILLNRVNRAWESVRSVLLVVPTGGGKTVIFAKIMHDFAGAKAAIVHRKEIVGQISCSLAKLDVKHRIVAPPSTIRMIRKKHLKLFGKSFLDPHAAAGVISVQTLTSRSAHNNVDLQRWLAQIQLAVFDEGHHYVQSGLWAKAVEVCSQAKLLFVTATPERADCKGLGHNQDGFAETLIEGPTTRELINDGYLCGFRYVAPESDLDVSGLVVTASGDLNTKALRARVVDSHLIGDTVQHYKQFAGGKRAIVFATDVKTSHDFAEAFNTQNVKAVALSGNTEGGERDRQLSLFEKGDIQVLINVDLFDEGFDVPAVEVVMLVRPTESLGKFLQMIGRGLRPVYQPGLDISTRDGRLAAIANSNKPKAIIIDSVRNWERHGMPDWPRIWTLAGREKGARSKRDDLIKQVVCAACTQPYEAFYTNCPYCGNTPTPVSRQTIKAVDGNLVELDVEAMSALFDKINQADMSDEDFKCDLNDRHVPNIGQPRLMRRHRAAKQRRLVLKEVIAWWFGMQHKRSIEERQKRFYYRFNIDVGNALTLDEKQTDDLILKIQQRFSQDML